MKKHIKPCNCKTCLEAKQNEWEEGYWSGAKHADEHYEKLLKAEYEKGFISGADTTGSQADEIHACELHDQEKELLDKFEKATKGICTPKL